MYPAVRLNCLTVVNLTSGRIVMKMYHGYRVQKRGIGDEPAVSACVVTVQDDRGRRAPLEPRLDIRNHSPTGFNWGYGGSGPAQLALALCLDALRDVRRAEHVYMQVKFRLVARLPDEGWSVSHAEILALVKTIEDEEPVGEIGDQSPAE